MSIRAVTSQGRELRLGDGIDSGGEGIVYEVDGQPGLVAKLLLLRPGDALTPLRLASLARRRRSPQTAAVLAGTMQRAAWPVATVTVGEPDVAGYVMPDMRLRFSPLNCLLQAWPRQERFPAATWATALRAAASLARLVADLHGAGYVVGDMKPGNLWADEHGNVGISDVDSFQFADDRTFFPCTSHTAGCTAPEGIDVLDPRLDKHSDDFVLAVIVYQLLMIGLHPFYGRPADGSPYISITENVLLGRSSLVRPGSVLLPPDAPPLSVLPADLRQLFGRCFGETGRTVPSTRPSAAEWLAALDGAADPARLRGCPLAAGHVHAAELAACPWCALATRGADPYPARAG